MIQLAVRAHFGYCPSSWDMDPGMTVQWQFVQVHFDSLNVQTREVSAFCDTASDSSLSTIRSPDEGDCF